MPSSFEATDTLSLVLWGLNVEYVRKYQKDPICVHWDFDRKYGDFASFAHTGGCNHDAY